MNEVQSKISLLDTATQRAGYGFADVCDKYLGSLLATSGTVKDGLGAKATPITITADNAYETLVKMKTALDKANLPKQERKVVVPPEFEGFMLLDPRFVAVPWTRRKTDSPRAPFTAQLALRFARPTTCRPRPTAALAPRPCSPSWVRPRFRARSRSRF